MFNAALIEDALRCCYEARRSFVVHGATLLPRKFFGGVDLQYHPRTGGLHGINKELCIIHGVQELLVAEFQQGVPSNSAIRQASVIAQQWFSSVPAQLRTIGLILNATEVLALNEELGSLMAQREIPG